MIIFTCICGRKAFKMYSLLCCGNGQLNLLTLPLIIKQPIIYK